MTEHRSFNEQIIDEFRANGGKVGGQFEGWSMLLLTTTGAKTGLPRTSPLVYTQDGERIVIIASNAGADAHPAWFTNLRVNPVVTVEVGEETFEAKAFIPEGDERDRLYAAQAAILPQFNEYEKKTSRRIPVVVLERTT